MRPLEVGRTAPTVALRDQHGRTVKLAHPQGRRTLLVFFPAAFSSVCDSELADLQAWSVSRQPADVELLGVSCDPMFALRAFSDARGIDYPLLSDFWPHGAVARAYGVFDDTRGMAGRSSFLVDGEGTLAWAQHNRPAEARSTVDIDRALEATLA